MFGGTKIRIRKALYSKITEASEALGCASVEEFVEGALEKEADRVLSKSGRKTATKEEVDDISKKLQGLGYID